MMMETEEAPVFKLDVRRQKKYCFRCLLKGHWQRKCKDGVPGYQTSATIDKSKKKKRRARKRKAAALKDGYCLKGLGCFIGLPCLDPRSNCLPVGYDASWQKEAKPWEKCWRPPTGKDRRLMYKNVLTNDNGDEEEQERQMNDCGGVELNDSGYMRLFAGPRRRRRPRRYFDPPPAAEQTPPTNKKTAPDMEEDADDGLCIFITADSDDYIGLPRQKRSKVVASSLLVPLAHLSIAASTMSSGSSTLFVGNLSYQTSAQDLGNFFSAMGVVNNVRVVTDRDTGRPKGFAFVEFADQSAAQQAISQLNGSELNGRQIRINWANNKN